MGFKVSLEIIKGSCPGKVSRSFCSGYLKWEREGQN